MTDDEKLAGAVERAVEIQLARLPRGKIAAASWRDFGAMIMVRDLDEAVPLVDAIAPEHLEIVAADADTLVQRIRNAGAIFIGAHTPEAIGDYCRRLQSRAADGALGAVFLGARRARFHEAHLDSEMRAGAIARAR